MRTQSINFSVAILVVLVHALFAWVWPVDFPVVRIMERQTPSPARSPLWVNTVIVPEPSTARLGETAPRQAKRVEGLQAQAAASQVDTGPAALIPGDVGSAPQQLLHPLGLPASTRLYYTLTKGSSSADAVLTWQIQPNTLNTLNTTQTTNPSYELTLEVKTSVISLLRQTSTGQLTASGLAPLRYGDKRVRKSEQAVHFDAVAGTLSFSNNRPQAAWVLGSQDRLSVLVQLAALAQGKAGASGAAGVGGAVDAAQLWRVGEVIELPVASTDELELWQWEVQAHAPEDLAGTIKLLRRPRRAFDASIEVWLGSSFGFMPVRIRQTDSSGVADQVLVRAQAL